MALVQHRQIADSIKNNYINFIDCSDLPKSAGEQSATNALSRGLASFVVAYLAGVDPVTAGGSITDGPGDNGVDAIFYDRSEKLLYLVQSKWNSKHSASVELGDVLKFINGCKDVLSSRFSKFNKKVIERSKEIDEAINQASKVVSVFVYSGSGSFSSENTAALETFLDEVDENRELISFQVVNQAQLYSMLLQGAAAANISSPVTLFDWGSITDPVKAVYGQVAVSDLVALHEKFGHRLFSRNIRMFLGDSTQVNSGIQATLSDNPDLLWYLNNGITALSSSVKRRAVGGATRASGVFDCEGFTVVNGAQTIGSLASAAKTDTVGIQTARLPIRIISLEAAPEGFAALVTRTNNTQNRIDSRNFVALDTQQERLRVEFAIDNIDYEYRQGEIENSGPTRLGLLEATIALACTQSEVDLAVQAKREIGKLWEDISRNPYRLLFNPNRTSEDIWSRVTAFRRIDSVIALQQTARSGRGESVVTHGNRFIMSVCYKYLLSKSTDGRLSNISDGELQTAVSNVVDILMQEIDKVYSDNYLASLFKNASKCKNLAGLVESALQAKEGKLQSTPKKKFSIKKKI